MNVRSRADSVRCLSCSQPRIVGLCTPCDTIRHLEAAVAHAQLEASPRLRAADWRERLDREIRAAEHIGLGRITLSPERARISARDGPRSIENGWREEARIDLAEPPR